MTYRIVCFGDSIIWGQGLKEEQKWRSIVRVQLAAFLSTNTEICTPILPHSGAIIGGPPRNTPGDPLNTSPGEVPKTRPTIREQVRSWSPSDGPNVDLVILDGGINDTDVMKIVLPFLLRGDVDSKELATRMCNWDAVDKDENGKEDNFHATVFEPLMELLNEASAKFPNALIVVTGYYMLLSRGSDVEKTRAVMIIYMLLTAVANPLQLSPFVDVVGEALIATTIRQTEFFGLRQLHWMRSAVAETNKARKSGRILFVHNGFGPRNAISADDPLLFGPAGTFDFPEDWMSNVANDIAPVERAVELLLGVHPEDEMWQERADLCADEYATGATPAEVEGDPDYRFCRLAALGHPNVRGAEQYAARTSAKLRREMAKISLRSSLTTLSGEATLSLRSCFQKYGFVGIESLRAQLQHMDIDCVTATILSRDSGGSVSITLGDGRSWKLEYADLSTVPVGIDMPYTIDTHGLRLEEVDQIRLRNESRNSWTLSRIQVQFNGEKVLDARPNVSIGPGADWVAPNYPN